MSRNKKKGRGVGFICFGLHFQDSESSSIRQNWQSLKLFSKIIKAKKAFLNTLNPSVVAVRLLGPTNRTNICFAHIELTSNKNFDEMTFMNHNIWHLY